ncbi:MAG: YciI family protein [Lapillicoccus sp.]
MHSTRPGRHPRAADGPAPERDHRTVDGGKTLTTDGPFVGMKEAVGSWFILAADDLDAVIEVAAHVLAARFGGAVEIRPSEVYW